MIIKYSDQYWMRQAYRLASKAQEEGEVPVGAILVLDNQIIGTGQNKPISSHDPTAHAEIIALRKGGLSIKNYRLLNTTLYVTLEPCIMCTGAIIQSRIQKLVYAAESKNKELRSLLISIFRGPISNHRIEILSGILEEECVSILHHFFRCRRAKKNSRGKEIQHRLTRVDHY